MAALCELGSQTPGRRASLALEKGPDVCLLVPQALFTPETLVPTLQMSDLTQPQDTWYHLTVHMLNTKALRKPSGNHPPLQWVTLEIFSLTGLFK